MCKRPVVFLLCLILSFDEMDFLENGLARSPPMGWMSWGYYMCSYKCESEDDKCLNEKLIMDVADAFFTEGYQEAGYEYIIIDDCWSEKRRDEYGRLVPDKKRFPRGMKFLADYIHRKGLKFGMYTSIGEDTCMLYPGSEDHFGIDVETFAEWEIDYLKVDGCFVTERYLNEAYITLGNVLRNSGRNIVYSCSWPYYIQFIHHKKPDFEKISQYCNLWRNYHDVVWSWNQVRSIMEHFFLNYDTLAKHHGPGKWNDPDMLIIGGRVLTESQSRIHIAVWAMWSAPLLISCDMSKVSSYEKKLLLNLDLIAINQDQLGIMARPHKISNLVTLLVKMHQPLKANSYPAKSFAFLNFQQQDDEITFIPNHFGLNSTDEYTIYDVFSRTYLKNVSRHDELKIKVPREDVILYTLYPL